VLAVVHVGGHFQYFTVPYVFLQEWAHSTGMAPESTRMAPESTGMDRNLLEWHWNPSLDFIVRDFNRLREK
jgi:hypothetical protein